MTKWESSVEEIKVKSGQMVDKVKELIHEGNTRRVSIRKDGRVLLEIPLSVGVGGATAAIMFTAPLAAVAAIAALVTDVEIIVEREPEGIVEVIEDELEGSDKE